MNKKRTRNQQPLDAHNILTIHVDWKIKEQPFSSAKQT